MLTPSRPPLRPFPGVSVEIRTMPITCVRMRIERYYTRPLYRVPRARARLCRKKKKTFDPLLARRERTVESTDMITGVVFDPLLSGSEMMKILGFITVLKNALTGAPTFKYLKNVEKARTHGQPGGSLSASAECAAKREMSRVE